jgi:transcription initiation factor TFIIIB Brf1 subunit/transcription initiation factor TFIIB
MIHPSEPEITRPLAVRDGHGAPVTCATCGCRLRAGIADNDIAWFHFNPLGGAMRAAVASTASTRPHDVAGYGQRHWHSPDGCRA